MAYIMKSNHITKYKQKSNFARRSFSSWANSGVLLTIKVYEPVK